MAAEGDQSGAGASRSEAAKVWPSGSPAAAAVTVVWTPAPAQSMQRGRQCSASSSPDARRLLSMPSVGPHAPREFQIEIPLLRVLVMAARGTVPTAGGLLGQLLGTQIRSKPGGEVRWSGTRWRHGRRTRGGSYTKCQACDPPYPMPPPNLGLEYVFADLPASQDSMAGI